MYTDNSKKTGAHQLWAECPSHQQTSYFPIAINLCNAQRLQQLRYQRLPKLTTFFANN